MVVLCLREGFLAEEEAGASSSRGRSSIVRGAFYAELRRDRFVRWLRNPHTRSPWHFQPRILPSSATGAVAQARASPVRASDLAINESSRRGAAFSTLSSCRVENARTRAATEDGRQIDPDDRRWNEGNLIRSEFVLPPSSRLE